MSESTTPDIGTGTRVTPERPWLGLRAYSLATQRYFFGRDRQAQELYERVCSQPLTVLYGRSGLGKTSLLGAGLLPRLKVEGRAAAIVRLRFDDEAPSLLEQVRAQLLVLLGIRLGDDDEHADPPSLWELAHGPQARDAIALERPVLIFDQFEEIFTLGRHDGAPHRRQQATQLLAELSDLIENREPPALQARLREDRDFALGFDHGASILRIVLTLREDFLHELERWKNRMPALMRNRMELTELDGPSALQAVLGPARLGAEPLLDEAVAAQIVRFVADPRADPRADTPLSDIEKVPPLLSLLCAELNQARIEVGAPRIGADQVTEQGGNILNHFCQRCFEGMPDAVRTVVEETLVDDSGKYRESSSRESVLAHMQEGSGEDCAACLDLLIERRLLTAELRGGAQRIELAHDLLVPFVAESRAISRDQRKAEDERRRAEAQQQEVAERGRQRLTKRGFVVTSVLFVAAVFFAWQSHKQGRELQGSVAQAAQRAFGRAQEQLEAGKQSGQAAYLAESLSYDEVPEAVMPISMALQQIDTMPLLRQLEFHADSRNVRVFAAQFSPDGRQVVAAGEDGTARLWDARTGAGIGEPMKHGGEVTSVQFNPSGTQVLTASLDGTAGLWDARTGAPLVMLVGHAGRVWYAQFSPDGRRVVTASRDATARLWNADTGAAMGEPLRHEDDVNFAQFSPDGTLVLTASHDHTTRLWDARTGAALHTLRQHQDAVISAQFSPDGRWIVTASKDGTARLWDARTGAALAEPLRHGREVTSAQFSPDGSRVATASMDGTAQIWDVRTGAALGEPLLHGGVIESVAFSADGRRVVTASWDGTARLWDSHTGAALGEPLRHEAEIWSAQFSADGAQVVTASSDGTARIWDAREHALVPRLLHHDGSVNQAYFSPDGSAVVTASPGGSARIWDARSGVVLRQFQHRGDVLLAQFIADGTQVVTVSSERTTRGDGVANEAGVARIWDAHTGDLLARAIVHDGDLSRTRFSTDGRHVVKVDAEDDATIWNVHANAVLDPPRWPRRGIRTVEFSSDGSRVLIVNASHVARIWDAHTGMALGDPLRNTEQDVAAAVFSADGMRVATLSWDRAVRIWDARSGAQVAKPLKHSGFVRSVQLNVDGTRLMTSSEKDAYVWDIRSGAVMAKLRGHVMQVSSAQLSPDGSQAITAIMDGTARVWDLRSLIPVDSFDRITATQALQYLGGKRVDDDGRLQDIDVKETIQWRNDYLAHTPTDTDFDRVIRWQLADRATRAISPFSELTVPEHIEREIDWALAHPQRDPDGAGYSPQILDDAYALNPAHPLILFALSVFEDRLAHLRRFRPSTVVP